jgi:hypothetical protein
VGRPWQIFWKLLGWICCIALVLAAGAAFAVFIIALVETLRMQ